MWKSSEGDVNATIKELCTTIKSDMIVPRERLLLKGLKRYGKDNPLAALRCLQHTDRVFFINAVRLRPFC